MMESSWRLFERVADDYDEVLPFFATFGAAIMEVIDPPAGCRFLDLGAGRGALSAAALARGCRVTAVDAAPAMVDRLTRSYPDLTAHVMDAQALRLPADSFDLVAAAFVINLLDHPDAGVAQAYRVLAPGGRFVFTGPPPTRDSPPEGPVLAPSLGGQLDALFAEYATFLPAGGGMGQPVEAAEVLTAAGFIDLRQHLVEITLSVPDGATLWRWAMSHGYRAFIEDLPAQRRRTFQDRLTALPVPAPLRRVTALWSGRKPGTAAGHPPRRQPATS